MKKINISSDNFEKSKSKTNNVRKMKTTDINILLNRVRVNKKIEFKQRVIFSSLLLVIISFVGFFYLFLK